ncbi:hypothetical protein M2372_002181 [Chryseobacterium sp. BIGb0232]|nr:hypothetical protein [Chryseobacterium sp. BIGb0232]ROS17390.1 hypothetical protein EDF65_1758 [Chryseobacterium nakagawai]
MTKIYEKFSIYFTLFFSNKLCFAKKWLDTHHYNNEFHIYKGMGHSISGVEV